MSAKEFWEDDPELLWAYRKSYIDKVKLQQENDNFNAWLSGLYVYVAISSCLSNKAYILKPYDFSKTEEQVIEERENSIKEQLKRGKKALSKGVDK